MDPASKLAISLNMDVIHIIMSYADLKVVSNIMKTCSMLNSEGAKYLLADVVSLRCDRTLQSFMLFLTARKQPQECASRLTFLTKLSLDFYHPTSLAARILEQFFVVVGWTLSFASLEISNAEALLATHPPLGPAIAKLTTLKALTLSDARKRCASLLRTLQSSLVFADITFSTSNGRSNMNPIVLLEGSQSTLECLRTAFAVSSPNGLCYVNVTSLSLSCIDLPVIEDYIHAFPNLLSLATIECSGPRNDPELREVRRTTSMLHQARHGTWRSLRLYTGSMLNLWTLGLTCRIHTIKMGFPQNRVDPDMLNDILSHARPLALYLALPGASCLLDEDTRAVLSVERGLQELDLRVLLHTNGNDQGVSIGDVLDLLVDIVRASAVHTFRLELDMSWMKVVPTRAERDGWKVRSAMPFEVYLQNMDVDAYADALLAKVASLREVYVSVVRPEGGWMDTSRRSQGYGWHSDERVRPGFSGWEFGIAAGI